MIIVHDSDGEAREFPDATRFATDEHNNLELYMGRQGEKLIHLYRRDSWAQVEVDVEA